MQIRMTIPGPALATVAIRLMPALQRKFYAFELEEELRAHCLRLLKKRKGKSPNLPRRKPKPNGAYHRT